MGKNTRKICATKNKRKNSWEEGSKLLTRMILCVIDFIDD
jgi:hypothetical protein